MKNVDLRNETTVCRNSLFAAIRNGRVKDWFYEFCNGHPFLLSEEVHIICETRFDKKYKWMNDYQIQLLIKIRVKTMYKNKFPNAKRWSLPFF